MKKKYSEAALLLPFVLVLALIVMGAGYISERSVREGARALEAQIKRAATACYAIEGAYPPGVEYLEEHYALVIDRDKYIYEYDAVGSNIMPWVAVTPKGSYYFEWTGSES